MNQQNQIALEFLEKAYKIKYKDEFLSNLEQAQSAELLAKLYFEQEKFTESHKYINSGLEYFFEHE